MTELLTAAQMRAIEKAAIDSGEVTGLELMERAGRGVVEAIFEEWPELAKTDHRAVVLCGPGNNGGDGFVVARLLKEWGLEVEVFLYGDAEKLPVDARVNYERWCDLGEIRDIFQAGDGRLSVFDSMDQAETPNGALVIDAVFGTGLSRKLDDDIASILECTKDILVYQQAKIVAIDIPSGVCADSGKCLGDSVWASLTVSFHRQKVGHFTGEGPAHCRKIVVVDIGLKSRRGISLTGMVFDLTKYGPTNKFNHGHALILSGGVGKGGAARMSARGALRIGAGLVTVGCPPAALQENAGRLDAIMLRSVKDCDALVEMLEDARINALCLGPGMGLGERQADLVAAALTVREITHPTEGRRAVVLDADALTLLAGDTALFGMLHDNCVLTPHGGEFARLFPDIAEKLEAPALKGPAYSKVDATREAAKRAGCVVLSKGPDTVIAAPDGRCSINSAHYERAAPWLATAGSGDVLAGFIIGLLARGFSPMQAAETGAWLHVECARKFGPGLIAEDLPEQLPAVFRDLGL